LHNDDAYLRYLRRAIRHRDKLSVTSQDLPIEVVLSDAKHFEAFVLFAESKSCAEPLLLWRRINEFKSQGASASFALNVWKNFLNEKAELFVPLSLPVRQRVRKAILSNTISRSLFDECQREVIQMICFSVFPAYVFDCFMF
jgi:hypothetical protein